MAAICAEMRGANENELTSWTGAAKRVAEHCGEVEPCCAVSNCAQGSTRFDLGTAAALRCAGLGLEGADQAGGYDNTALATASLGRSDAPFESRAPLGIARVDGAACIHLHSLSAESDGALNLMPTPDACCRRIRFLADAHCVMPKRWGTKRG